jgi:hypothetical protein
MHVASQLPGPRGSLIAGRFWRAQPEFYHEAMPARKRPITLARLRSDISSDRRAGKEESAAPIESGYNTGFDAVAIAARSHCARLGTCGAGARSDSMAGLKR